MIEKNAKNLGELETIFRDFVKGIDYGWEMRRTESNFSLDVVARPEPEPEPEPEVEPTVYLLRGTDRHLPDRIVEQCYELGAGVSLRWSWSDLEPTRGNYDWTAADEQVGLCEQAGIPFQLRLMAGFRSPKHSTDRWVEAVVQHSSGNVETGMLPLPWSAQYQERIDAMLARLATRYQEAAVIHVPWWRGGSETMKVDGLTNHPQFTPYVAASWHWNRARRIRENAGPYTLVSANVAPPGGKPWVPLIMQNILDIPGGVVQSNALSAKPRLDTEWYAQIVEHPGATGWQMVSASNQDRFGGTLRKAIELGQRAKPLYYEVYEPDLAEACRLVKEVRV